MVGEAPLTENVVERTSERILQLIQIRKAFGRVQAVDRVSIDVHKGEVLTLLGPSGCGKTTTLRLVIGLERCDGGEIVYRGRVIDSVRSRRFLPTHKRDMGIVFQSYAIWPHMTVFENIAYPLRVRRMKDSLIKEKVERVLELVNLQGLERRPATALSGGQQQRVALARSLVFEPDILLLDEPFSNLDAKLREHMRAEVKVLQRRLGVTVLFVTHDQFEALSLSDRVAVMHQGNIEQVGAPEDLYWNPATPIVRDFLGRTIVLRGTVTGKQDHEAVVALQSGNCLTARNRVLPELAVGQPCYLAVRPEKVEVKPESTDGLNEADGRNTLSGWIEALLFVGDRYEARVQLPWGDSILIYLPTTTRWRERQEVRMTIPEEEVQVWPAQLAPQ